MKKPRKSLHGAAKFMHDLNEYGSGEGIYKGFAKRLFVERETGRREGRTEGFFKGLQAINNIFKKKR